MITKKIEINKGNNVYLNCFLHNDGALRPAVLVCPGGGYMICAPHEGDVIAEKYFEKGYNTFTLYYSLEEKAAFPTPLTQLSCAMKIIRDNAAEFEVNTDKIAVLGFSAGGHLAASLGVHWNLPEVVEKSGCQNGENKPNALILCYPVITTRSWMVSHLPRLIGDRDYDETLKLLDCSENIGEHTPPAFLVHTFIDNTVSVNDSLYFAKAMEENNIPFELHIFPNGKHGLGLGEDDPSFSKWFELSLLWLERLFDDTPQPPAPNRAPFIKK